MSAFGSHCDRSGYKKRKAEKEKAKVAAAPVEEAPKVEEPVVHQQPPEVDPPIPLENEGSHDQDIESN